MVSTTSNAPRMDRIVEAVGLTKVFRDFWMRTKARAVDGIDFDIRPNEIFGLLGPNGSGKSTTIKMILGLLNRTSGRLTVFGRSPTDVAVKKWIGFLPEESYLYRYLNGRETLDYYGKLFGIDRRTRRRRTEELLEMVGLSAVAHRALGEYSKGMTRRIGLAQALVNDPELLILDEPTSGLDPIGTRQVKDLLIDLRKRGKTILLSSHLLADVEDVCDRMVMLYGGKIRAQGTSDELLQDTAHTVIHAPRLKPSTIERIERVIREEEGTAIERVDAPRQRLEQLFLDIVERARAEQAATSGAVDGGGTAAFLRGEAESEGGAALIEHLVAGAEAQQKARELAAEPGAGKAGMSVKPVKPGKPVAGAPAAADDDMLAELLQAPEEPATPGAKAAPAEKPRERPADASDVESSVIDALLDDDGDDDGDASRRESRG